MFKSIFTCSFSFLFCAIIGLATMQSMAQNPIGLWKVKGTNAQKGAYTGTLDIKKANADVYTLYWKLANGSEYGGLGMLKDNNFYVSWGQSIEYGIVVYKILANGNLDGKWVSKSGYTALINEFAKKTEANTNKTSSLIGNYQVNGGTGKTAYSGTLIIKAGSNAGHFLFSWQIGNSISNGVGFLNGSEIVVAWGYGEAYGVVHYVMQGNNKAKGTWAIPNHQGILTEDIEK